MTDLVNIFACFVFLLQVLYSKNDSETNIIFLGNGY